MNSSRICLMLLVVSGLSCATLSRAQNPGKPATSSESQAELGAMNAKLAGITIPEFKLDGASLSDAIGKLRAAAQDNDKTAAPERKGINIFVKSPGGAALPTTPITLDLKSVSLKDALEAVAKQSGVAMKVEPYAVSYVVKR